MTRLVILSDTHMPRRNRTLPGALLDDLRKADLIIHLGDFDGSSFVQSLRALGPPLRGVHGNNDSAEVRQQFPVLDRLEVDGHRLVLLHGHHGGPTAERAAQRVAEVDAVLFGHSHRAMCEWQEDRLLFNPGSPTERRFSAHASYGVIDVTPTSLKPEVKFLT